MNENPQAEGDLAEEFRRLGNSLQEALKTAWESEERRSLTKEIQDGLDALGDSVKQAASEFAESSTGQRVKAEVDEFADRVRSGQVTAELREDLLAALMKVSAELEALSAKWTKPGGGTADDAEG
jgi:mevalonate kinase